MSLSLKGIGLVEAALYRLPCVATWSTLLALLPVSPAYCVLELCLARLALEFICIGVCFGMMLCSDGLALGHKATTTEAVARPYLPAAVRAAQSRGPPLLRRHVSRAGHKHSS